ncbi:hypothetical protein HRW11_00985 [Streptomyces lunaelactis]|uniref:hypothetical protein n=1 Tax=Streptomyces lunaelactis TaxID=1535768 RepID=UPI001584771B|nr:hypothetical protein [Streptomyces lunaelactis]NUK62719.1 hypothetical protein [Streptomyces lunaelactis]
MNIWLPFRLVAATAVTGLMLTACGSSGESPTASGSPSAAPRTSSPSHSPATPVPSATAATTPPGTRAPTTPAPGGSAPVLGSGSLQPLWPFATLAEAQAWQRDYRSGGHQPWHLDPDRTALSFTQGYLGFRDIGRISSHSVSGAHARIGVALSGPEGGTAAIVHLVRYGTGPDAPWEVVGTDDTTFSLTVPGYGSIVRSPLVTGGRVTGVGEGIRLQGRQPSSGGLLGSSCCSSAGGNDQPWKQSVSFSGARDPVLTVVASTGGHIAEVERFTVTAVRTG